MRKLFFKYAMLCMVLLLVGCSEDVEYAKVVPLDATAVYTIDLNRIVEESGLLSDGATESEKQFVESYLSKLSVGKEELMRRYIKDPKESGIDWNKKMYSFETADTQTKVFVLSVIDPQKVKTAIEVFTDSNSKEDQFDEEAGFAWLKCKSFYVAISDKALVIVSSLGTEKRNNIKDRVAVWLNQSEEQSFVSSKYHKMFKDLKGEIVGYTFLTGKSEDVSMIAKMVYADKIEPNSVAYLADISFGEGQMKFDGKLVYENQKLFEWLKNQQKVFKKIDGKSLRNYPASTSVWASVGLDGDKLYDHLLDHPVYGKELKEMRLPFNLEGVLRSIDGDVTIGYPTGLRMDVKNKELLKILVGTAKTMGSFIGIDMEEIAPDEYRLFGQTVSKFRPEGRKLNPCAGMKDGTFYLLSDSVAVRPFSKEASLANAPWADNIEDYILFAAFDFDNGSNLLNSYSRSLKKNRLIRQYFDYITLGQKDVETNQIVLSFVDKEKNILQQLIEMYLQYNR